MAPLFNQRLGAATRAALTRCFLHLNELRVAGRIGLRSTAASSPVTPRDGWRVWVYVGEERQEKKRKRLRLNPV